MFQPLNGRTYTLTKVFSHNTLRGVSMINRFFFLCILLIVGGCTNLSLSGPNDPKSALLNGLTSGDLGVGLDKTSRNKAVNAEYAALEKGASGVGVKWQARNNKSGVVTPGQQYQVGPSTCRRFLHIIKISGSIRQATRTACKDQSGIWELLE